MPFSISSSDGVSRVLPLNPEDNTVTPMNCLVVSSPGGGKTLALEALTHFFYRHGWTVISLSDVKDRYEQAFSMFAPEARYHLNFLEKYGVPIAPVPTKLYHPFTFSIPHSKLPEINFYTIDIKSLNRIDLNFLAESNENKRSIQIILQEIKKLKHTDGIFHLVFNAENQTESSANITKAGIRFRSNTEEDFFTRSKLGTEKTSSEFVNYFTPFLHDYSIAPSNAKTNLQIVNLMNDNRHYHIFSTRWVQDRRLKAFYVLHILQDIINHEAHARHPILIVLEEIRFLTPNNSDGFSVFLAQEIKNTLTRMRNMGRGFGIAATTQVYRDVAPEVVDSFNELVFGKITSLKEKESIAKALKLSSDEFKLLNDLEIGDFLIRAKGEYETEPSLQPIKFFLPGHAHNEVGMSFFERYAKEKPESLRQYTDLIKDMQLEKERIINDVKMLKDQENEKKKEALRKEQEQKQSRQRDKTTQQEQQIKVTTQEKEALDEKMKELIYADYMQKPQPSQRTLAKKYGLLRKDGTPNNMAVLRAVESVRKKLAQQTPTTETTHNTTSNDDPPQ